MTNNEEELLPFCECGECGLRVTKKGNRFVIGHNFRGKSHTPEACAAISAGMLGIPKSPEHIAANSKGHKGVPLSPEHIAAIKKAQTGVPKSPEHCTAISKAQKGVPKSPEHIAAIKKGQEESGVYETQRGGNDLVTHHYIYDESDLSLNTVQMTRSDHMKLHYLLRKLGYIVPHINVNGEI